MGKGNQSYDYVCFRTLAYEFGMDDKSDIKKSIKRKLKYYSLGPYVQERVDYIRQLKNELYLDIIHYTPIYYKKSDSKFTHPNDFYQELIVNDYMKKYPQISKEDMSDMVDFAIYLFYLR